MGYYKGPKGLRIRGRLAYRFAQSGELQQLARCSGKGWKVEKGACYPYPAPNEGTYGWGLP